MDFYRLHDEADALDLGFDEYFYLDGLTVIEWSKRAATILPRERLSLELQLHDDMRRSVTITATDTFVERLHWLERELAGNAL